MKSKYSKQDYELIASVLRDARTTFTDDAHTVALAHIAGRIAATFQADNPQFDLERFSKACGIIKE